MRVEIGLAIILALFPFGYDMLGFPHVRIIGVASWVVCLCIFAHLIWTVVWFRGLLERHPKRVSAALGALVMLVLCGAAGLYWANGPDYTQFRINKPLENIYGKTYVNETIEIDGKDFDHCTFENVTLIYHGLSPWSFEEATFRGNTAAETDNMAAKQFTTLMTWIQHQQGVTAFAVGDKDKNGNVKTQSFDLMKNGPSSQVPPAAP